MKVITEKGGLKAKAVNDKAAIEHGIAQKTELSKKSGGKLENQQVRTVGGTEKAAKSDMPNGAPSVAAQKREHFAKEKSAKTNGKIVHQKPNLVEHPEKATRTVQEPHSAIKNTSVPIAEAIKTTKLEKTKIASSRPPKKFKLSQNRPRNKSYKVLKNGVVNSNGLTKKKARVIYKQKRKQLRKRRFKLMRGAAYGTLSKTGKFTLNVADKATNILKNGLVSLVGQSDDNGAKVATIGTELLDYGSSELKSAAKTGIDTIKSGSKLAKEAYKLHKQKAKVKHFRKKFRNKKLKLASLKSVYSKLSSRASSAASFAAKPTDLIKRGFSSLAEKSDDNGVKAFNLGIQIADYGKKGASIASNAATKSVRTVKKGYEIVKDISQFRIKKRVKRGVRGKKKRITNRIERKSAKVAAKSAKKAAQAAKKAATQTKAAQKAAEQTASTISSIARLASFLSSTKPYSQIIIGVIVLILIVSLMVVSFVTSASGSVTSAGGWLIDDEKQQSPEEIYDGYKKFEEQIKEVVQEQVKEALKSKVTSFCSSDTDEPRKIIQYIDKDHNRTFFPAQGSDEAINSWIDEFEIEDYAEYLSLLFVLKTREMQVADGVLDSETYDMDFEKEDFEEFIKSINENACSLGETFVIKTAVEKSSVPCPNKNCKRKTITNCKCAAHTDEEGVVHYYCKGHPYCPENHTKLTVTLYSIKDYYGKDYSEIYNFSDYEKARYEASKMFIQAMLEYWENEDSEVNE